jgi:RNA polymerase sigma factor (sigma-70 family)
MNEDGDLLRRYARDHDQAAFRQLVAGRIGFVYAVNLRRLRNPHLAEEATQAVFVALARKAPRVAEGPSVIGWLHRSSLYESRNLLRAQAHRLARESEAQRLGTAAAEPTSGGDTTELASVIDEVLGEVNAADREAVLARFFCDQSYTEIGAALRVSENAARMRVERALDKLRARLQRRGFSSTAAVLATALPACATAAVPTGLAASVADAALATVTTVAGTAAVWTFMSTTKFALSAAALVAVGGTAYQFYHAAELQTEIAAVRAEHAKSLQQVTALQHEVSTLRTASVQAAAAAFSSVAKTPPAPPPEEPLPPGVTRTAPAGWHKNGQNPQAYDVGVDAQNAWGGMPSAYVRSKSASGTDGFGGMMQTLSAEAYHGKRVRLTGWVKTEDANDAGGHLWMRVDGQNRMLQFDNMDGRAPKGTTDWQEYSVVLDVPAEATTLNYGFFIGGSGKMWVNGMTIDPVSPEVPTTELKPRKNALPQTPVNLGFSPKPASG